MSYSNLVAMKNWLEKYSMFQNSNLFLSGEGYAGIVIPNLAKRMAEHNENSRGNDLIFNLRGWALGNPLTDWTVDSWNALPEAAYDFGYYDLAMYQDIQRMNCDFNQQNFPKEKYIGNDCFTLWTKFTQKLGRINFRDLSTNCNSNQSLMAEHSGEEDFLHPLRLLESEGDAKARLQYVPSCTNGKNLVHYMNRHDVKSALHIPPLHTWRFCDMNTYENHKLNHDGSVGVYQWFKKQYPHVKMFIYSGDSDGVIPTAGTEKWINNLNWPVYKTWKNVKTGNNVTGYQIVYDNLTFDIIINGGHSASEIKRLETYSAVFTWINTVIAGR